MSLRTVRQFTTLPNLPQRGPLPSIVSVIIPIERTNLVTNPSIELATTGYTAVGGSIARSATAQYHGTYSLAVTPGAGTTDGAYYGTISLTSGTIYAFSCKFKGIAGIPYKLSIATTGGVDLSVYPFIATGRWQWVYGYYLETSSTTRRVYFTKNGSANVGVFYVDGVQVETINAGETVSTYIDGDQAGLIVNQQPPAYLWNGTPHASISTRSALTRAGGYVVNLSTYNFLLTGLIGFGLATPNNISIPYTVLDGARYVRTTKPPHALSLAGRIQADDYFTYQQSLSDLRQVFDRDLVPLQQPMVLIVEPQDECGNVIGDFAQVQCLYAGGLEGNDSNYPVQDVAPTFTTYVPFFIGGNAGVALSVQQTVTNSNAIVQRTPTGVWQALGTGMSGGGAAVLALAYDLDGTLYAGGDFTDAGGSGADYIAKWNGSAWAVVKSATSLNARVNVIAVGPDGRIYVGGNFTDADGNLNADRIAVYDPNANTWAALGTGASSGGVIALCFDNAGNLYAGGTFASMGGVANTASIAKWNGSAWVSIGNVAGATVSVQALVSDGVNVYAGGDFTSIGGVGAIDIAKWNGSAWSPLGSGIVSGVQRLVIGSNGILYAGGGFTTAGGVTANDIAQWNGASWSPVGGATALNGLVNTLAIDGNGAIYAGGLFTTAQGVPLPDNFARFIGSTWLPTDINLPGSATVYILNANRNALAVGFDTAGSSTSAAVTVVTNAGPSIVYPRLVIKGPTTGTASIYQIVNYTTGFGVWFRPYTIKAGETATFIFDPTSPSFRTNDPSAADFGDLTYLILPGSSPSMMHLSLGANNISFFATDSSVTATLSWQLRYNGVADLVN